MRRMVRVARYLRQHEVLSERILWEALRNRQLDGVRFKRQQPIDRFVVDFIAPAGRLVVEVDGSVHDDREDLDQIRQAILERRGLRFVRVRSEEVERDLPRALERIRRALRLPLSRIAGDGAGG
jgi:very-short-patch-repair endonuclease